MFDTIYTRKGEAILVSPEDWRELAQYSWYVSVQGYACRKPGAQVVLMHREVLRTDAQTVDHANGDRLDNRRENLREATFSQNNYNRGCRGATYRGVTCDRRDPPLSKPWKAAIRVGGKELNLGRYVCAEYAATAYALAAYLYLGEFAHE